MKPKTLSHLNATGEARMVDVGQKPETARLAIARGELHYSAPVAPLLEKGKNPKGDVFATARIAGIMAAKNTANLIPLCHSLVLNSIEVGFSVAQDGNKIEVMAEVRTVSRTGVEMEALTAVSVALLTLYDMLKSADKAMRIENVRLEYKKGGKSGAFRKD